jgi:hypothetical protein
MLFFVLLWWTDFLGIGLPRPRGIIEAVSKPFLVTIYLEYIEYRNLGENAIYIQSL